MIIIPITNDQSESNLNIKSFLVNMEKVVIYVPFNIDAKVDFDAGLYYWTMFRLEKSWWVNLKQVIKMEFQ